MSVQSRTNNINKPFILSGDSLIRNNETILQDAGRTAVLAPFTVMAKVAASQKWVPFTDETAVDGGAIPQGIYLGPEIAAADLVAGDVIAPTILIGDGIIDEAQLILDEGATTLDTVITVGTTDLRTVKDHLANRGIFVEETVAISSPENA